MAVVLTGDRRLAEDVVQEVLVRVFERWAKIGGLDRPEFCVRRMVVNECRCDRRECHEPGNGCSFPAPGPSAACAEDAPLGAVRGAAAGQASLPQ